MILDVSQVTLLAGRLARSEVAVAAAIAPVMTRAGVNIKRAGQADARGVQNGRISAAWSFDVKPSRRGVEIEAGPVEGGAGSLAFFYYGNSKIGPRISDPVHILDSEADATARFLGAAIRRAL